MKNKLYGDGRGKYTKAGYLAYQQSQILELFHAGKIQLAEKITLEMLSNYPDDYRLKKLLVHIYKNQRKYDEAIAILEDQDEKYVYDVLSSFYIKVDEREKLEKLYQKYFSQEYVSKKLHTSSKESLYYNRLLYLKQLFDSEFQISRNELNYYDRQFYSYDEQDAISYIRDLHQLDQSMISRGVFRAGIDLKQLMKNVHSYIEVNKNQGILGYPINDMYLFSYANCGRDSMGEETDCFLVNTIVNTSSVVNMTPVSFRQWMDICSLDDEKKIEAKSPVKVKNGLERFNARYGKK